MNKLAKYIIAAVATAIVLFLLWYFSDIVAYILVSAVLAVMGQPLVDGLLKLRIRNHHLPHWLAALITLLAIWAMAILFFYLFIPLIFNKLNELMHIDYQSVLYTLKEPLSRAQNFLSEYFSISVSDFSLSQAITDQLGKIVDVTALNNIVSSIVSVAASTVVALFSISFITFFFLKEQGLFYNMVTAIFPSKYEINIKRALDSVTKLLSRYFVGILCESTIVMLIVSLTLLCFGFGAANAFFIGIVVGVLNVIPYVGPWIGFGISALVGITFVIPPYATSTIIIIIGAVILTAQMIDNFLLQPVLYSKQVKAHPLEIFIVILIAGSVAGVLGMLLAIPGYTVLRVFAKEFFNNWKLVRKLTENI